MTRLGSGEAHLGLGEIPPRFIDAHVHLWDLAAGFDYSWLDGADDGALGRISEIRFDNWDSARFAEEVRHSRPDKIVHVQATNLPTNAVDETRWLASQAAEHGLPDAIVGRVELRSPHLAATLDNHRQAAGTFCGVRDMSTMGSLADEATEVGLAVLERSGLSWEASCTWQEMGTLLQLAGRFPDLPIVLGHSGWPSERTNQYFGEWDTAIHKLAAASNVTCKVSGLGMADHAWTVESWRPWVDSCLDAFGPDRCMFGSNWPVERIYSSYDCQVRAMSSIIGGLNEREADDFWYATAGRIYNLNEKEETTDDIQY